MMSINEKGLTLIEVISTMAIFSIILVGLYGLFGGALKHWDIGSSKIDVQQNARIALNMIEMDVRAADYVVSGSNATSLRLYVNNKETRYHLSGTQILKSVGGEGNNPVAYNISSLEFTYFPATSQCSLVEIYLQLDQGGNLYTYSSKINIRAAGY